MYSPGENKKLRFFIVDIRETNNRKKKTGAKTDNIK